MDDIVRLPPVNPWVGSCPHCGLPLRKSDAIVEEGIFNTAVYQCLHCKEIIHAEELVPF